ncbi:MAG TPA: alginate lyase family protein [Thermoanaerobaculia bacterium]|nr:alginate lyase family protein [Thermoanaerobaculia bacterium]
MRLFETVRHLSAQQIATRALRMAQRKVRTLTNARVKPVANVRLRPHVSLAPPGDAEHGRAVANGRFRFLNEERVSPRWDEPSASQLWRYHLHYFDYARDLDASTFSRLALSWIDANERLAGDGWHPYTVSLRIVNWCEAIDAFGDVDNRILASLYAQARFLAAHLEVDVRGNHLLKNLRALIWAGTFFEGSEPDAWRDRALRMLESEVAEQVLPDGGHFERAPAYHVQVLRDLAETAEFLRRNGIVLAWLETAVQKMKNFLAAITPRNGRIPLLKDSTRVDVDDLLGQRATDSGQRTTTYLVARNAGDFLIADFGYVCPDDLPAHAHADVFTYELTIDDQPVVVDSGVYEYAAGEWRDHFRSTPAHNTVDLDGRNQSDVYDSFRVGKRARVRNVQFLEAGDLLIAQGEHDGYAPAIHRRTIVAAPLQRVWVFVDEIFGAEGASAHSSIHLHPAAASPALATFGAQRVFTRSGWYSETFGEKQPNRVIVLEAAAPCRFGYAISAEGGVTMVADGEEIAIKTGALSLCLSLPRHGRPAIR